MTGIPIVTSQPSVYRTGAVCKCAPIEFLTASTFRGYTKRDSDGSGVPSEGIPFAELALTICDGVNQCPVKAWKDV